MDKILQSKPEIKRISNFKYFQILDSIVHIPGENPGQASLCGTNVFLVGQKISQERIMIDAGDVTGKNETFISNLIAYFNDYFNQYKKQPYISKILLTHGHHDHFGGLFDVIQCLKQELGQTYKPQIYKMLDDNQFEREIFQKYPQFIPETKILDQEIDYSQNYIIQNIKDQQQFLFTDPLNIDECKNQILSLKSIYTPGHISDHMSFIYSGFDIQNILFSGDIILGTPSTSVTDLPKYMETLYKLKDEKLNFSHICLPHSVSLNEDEMPGAVLVNGPEKLFEYIEYRESRLKQLSDFVQKENGVSKEQIYDELYGKRGLEGKIKLMAINNLEQQIDYLLIQSKIKMEIKEQKHLYLPV